MTSLKSSCSAERPSSAAGPLGETSPLGKPSCRPRLLQWMDNHHGLAGMGGSLSQLEGGIKLVACPSVVLRGACTSPPRFGIRPPPHPEVAMMRFYTTQHPFYCGIDLHARTMRVCILDQQSTAVFDR